jgi:hypothetical protein
LPHRKNIFAAGINNNNRIACFENYSKFRIGKYLKIVISKMFLEISQIVISKIFLLIFIRNILNVKPEDWTISMKPW